MSRNLIALGLALSLPLGLAAQAQTTTPVESKEEMRQQGNYLKSLDDMDVLNAAGETIGEIEDVLIDETGAPVAVVIEIGGFLGLGDAEAIVPMDALTYDDGVYRSKMTQEQLENLPRWDD